MNKEIYDYLLSDDSNEPIAVIQKGKTKEEFEQSIKQAIIDHHDLDSSPDDFTITLTGKKYLGGITHKTHDQVFSFGLEATAIY